jgi:hypothetical protein
MNFAFALAVAMLAFNAARVAVTLPFAAAGDVHRLAVDGDRGGLERGHGLGDELIALRPVIAPPGEQTDTAVLLPRDQAVAVVLNLMKPLWPRGAWAATTASISSFA